MMNKEDLWCTCKNRLRIHCSDFSDEALDCLKNKTHIVVGSLRWEEFKTELGITQNDMDNAKEWLDSWLKGEKE